MTTSTIDPIAIDHGGRPAPVLELARRLHETVAQRLAGIAYLLAADRQLSAELTDRCRSEVEAALAEMREVLSSVGAVEDSAVDRGAGVAREVRALLEEFPALELRWSPEEHAGIGPAGLVEGFMIEGLRNVRKHAQPSKVVVEVLEERGVVVLEVLNDGVGGERGASCGVGRRLLELEASLHGALVESAPVGGERWSLRLILPVAGRPGDQRPGGAAA